MRPNEATLRPARENKNLGLRELARRVDISHQFLGRLEAGKATASVETFTKLASELNVPVALIAVSEAVPAAGVR